MSDEKKLAQLFQKLPAEQRRGLLEFAEFLAAKSGAEPQHVSEPLPIARPAQESVVKALKRLMQTYPMLDRGKLLHETSHYMTQHLMQGRAAQAVIDELEAVFARHYEKLRGGE